MKVRKRLLAIALAAAMSASSFMGLPLSGMRALAQEGEPIIENTTEFTTDAEVSYNEEVTSGNSEDSEVIPEETTGTPDNSGTESSDETTPAESGEPDSAAPDTTVPEATEPDSAEPQAEEKPVISPEELLAIPNEELTEDQIEILRATDVLLEGSEPEVYDVCVEDFMSEEEINNTVTRNASRNGSNTDSHQIVLLLDVSGSMSGKPMTEMKKACNNFVDQIMEQDPRAEIGIVTFGSEIKAYTNSGKYFTNNINILRSIINGLKANGGTPMNAGMLKADEIFQSADPADQRIIITMADGEPNEGATYRESDAKFPGHTYESAVYNTFSMIQRGYRMYSLGFFHSISGSKKDFVAEFMRSIQNVAYFEVTDADLITFSFEAISENINDDKIRMSQKRLALSKGGTKQLKVDFTDEYTSSDKTVTWMSSNTKVATVVDGFVTAVGDGECVVSATAGGYTAICNVIVTPAGEKLSKKILTVYKNKKYQDKEPEYVTAKNAVISYDNVCTKTNKDGVVTVLVGDEGELTVSLDKYRSRTFDVSELKDKDAIYLQKETDNPIVNAAYINGTNAIIKEVGIDYLEKNETTIQLDMDWGKSSCESVVLVQGSATPMPFDSNYKLSAVLKDKGFDVSKDIYIVAKNKDGKSAKVKLLIEVGGKLTGFDGAKIGFDSDGLSFNLPKDWPLVGEKEIKFGFDDLDNYNWPVSTSIEDGKVLVSIGVDVAKLDNGSDNAKDDARKEVFKKIKKVLSEKDVNKKQKALGILKQGLKEGLKETPVEFGVEGKVSIIGYIEGYIDSNGNVQFLEGQICFSPSVGVNWYGQFTIPAFPLIPCYWEAAIKGQIDAWLTLWKNADAAKYLPTGKIEIEIAGEIGGGVGVKEILTLGGGGKLTISPTFNFYSGGRKTDGEVSVGLNAYFKGTLGMFEGRYDTDQLSYTWKIGENKNAVATRNTPSTISRNLYEAGTYSLADTTYLEGSSLSVVVPSDVMAPYMSVSSEYADIDKALHVNSFANTQPHMVSLSGNTKLAVWLDGDSSDQNKIQLYFSYFDGNEWSDPAAVNNDGTADMDLQICVNENRAFVIWQNVERALVSNETLDTISSAMGIKVAEFKPATMTFEVADLSKNSGKLDMMPTITYADDKVVAGWVENANNKWFGTAKDNKIITAVFDGTSWGAATEIATEVGAVNSLAVDYKDNAVYAIYSCDNDGDLNTIEDLELYVNGTKATENESVDSAVQIKEHVLYWYSDSKVMASVVGGTLTPQEYMGGGVTIPTDRFRIVNDGEQKAVLFAVQNEATSEVYGVFKQGEQWGYPIQLTARNNLIQQFDAVWEDGNLAMLCNEIKVADPLAKPSAENYGQSDLIVMKYDSPVSVKVNSIAYDEEDIVPGSALPIAISLTNNSKEYLDGILVELIDENGNVVDSLEVGEKIASGNMADIDYSYIVSDTDIGKTYEVRCTPVNGSHETAADGSNVAEISFMFEDLKLDNVTWGLTESENGDSDIVISGAVQNLGYSSKDNIAVTLYEVPEPETDGEGVDLSAKELVTETTIGSLASRDQQLIEFHVDVPTEDNYEKIYYVELTCENENGSSGNNSSYVCIKESNNYVVGRNIIDLTPNGLETDIFAGSIWGIDNVTVTATYDDGTMADVPADINASAVNPAVPGVYPLTIAYDGFTKSYSIVVKDKQAEAAKLIITQNNAGTAAVNVGDTTKDNGVIYEVTGTGNTPTVKVSKPDDTSLKSVTINSTVTIKGVEYKVTAIGAEAFKGCSNLKSVKIPEGVTEIGNSAFADCAVLKTVVIPSTVEKIGKKAFYNTEKLKKVTIKTTKLTSKNVGKKAFKNAGSSNYKKLKIKVPKKKVSAYKKMLRKKGLSSKAKVTK